MSDLNCHPAQANSTNVNCGTIQNAVALLCNLSGDTVLDLEPVNQQGESCLRSTNCVFCSTWSFVYFVFP